MQTTKFTKSVRALTLAATLSVAFATSAETYYWNKADDNGGVYYSWSDPANWLVGDGKTAATSAPGAGDVIKRDNTQQPEKMYVDLDGASVEIGAIFFAEGSWGADHIYIKNGALTISSGTTSFYTPTSIDLYDATLSFNADSLFGHGNYSDNSLMKLSIHDGGVLELNAKYTLARVEFAIDEGGTLRFGADAQPQNANANVEVPIVNNGGTIDMPKGYANFKNNPWSYRPHITQNSGCWILGGKVSYVNNIWIWAELVGGTLAATDDASFKFHESGWGKFDDGADVMLDVAEGKTLDLSNFTYDGAATVRKTGTGKLKLSGVPSGLWWMEGSVEFGANTCKGFSVLALPKGAALALPNANTTIESLASMDGTLTIAAPGLTVTAVGSSLTGTFAIDASAFQVGDVVLASASEALRAKVMADLKATGNNIIEEGDVLKIGASELVFDSTTVKDLSDPEGWRNKAVPPAGANVTIAGAGVDVGIDRALPAWASITLSDGAKLTTRTECSLGKISLTGGASLEIVAETTLADGLAFEDNIVSADGMSALKIDSGATLKVPGGTKFKNVALTIEGTLIGLTDGSLVFGTANADETAFFAMATEGATITALNAAGKENGSRIDFAVPAVGGTVVVTEPIALVGTTFTYNSKDGFAFGLNNPSDQAFQVIAEGTPLDIGAETSVAGGANLVLDNSVLLRKRHSEGDTGDSYYNIGVLNRGRITLRNGGEIRAGVTRVNGNLVDGAIRVNPDEEGYVGIEVLEGGVANWYKLNGYGKGAVRFADGVCKFFKSYWHGWGNRVHVLNNLQAVEIAEGTTMTVCGTNQTFSSNNDVFSFFELESPFSGAGDLCFENRRTGKTMEPVIISGNSTCTGTLKVLPDNGTAKTLVHFANGANWAGTVVWNDRVDLIPTDDNHKDAATTPTVVSFGALSCEESATFTFRLWGGEEFRCDTVNLTGAGWGEGFTLNFAAQGGYEAKPGDVWCLGTIPADSVSVLPAAPSEKWRVYTEAIEGDADFVKLMAGPASLEYNFVSTESGDLTDPKNWECGYVPTGKDVVIKGSGVRATVTDAAPMPVFGSIEVREGATLAFLQHEGEALLPSLALDATATVTIGGEGLAPIVTLAGLLDSHVAVEGDAVQLPTIAVAAGATLNVPGGTNFKNCRMILNGTVVEQGAGKVTFGGAQSGETAYFALMAEGATIIATNGVAFASPDAGGTVVVMEPIILKDSTLTYADRSGMAFGLNNPTSQLFEVVADNTPLNYGYDSYVAGGAHLILTNGTVLFRAYYDHSGANFNYKDYSTYNLNVRNCGRITVHDGCEIRAGLAQGESSTTQGVILLNPDEKGYVCIDMKDGSVANWWKMNGNKKGVVRFGNCVYKCFMTQWWSYGNGMRAFYDFAAMEIADDATFTFQGTEERIQDTNDNAMDKFEFFSPFTGSGDVIIQNARQNKTLKAHLVSGANTCTGSLALGTDEGTAKSELWIDKGANWAGTLVWDERTHLVTEDDVPVSVTFGNLKLASGDFPIRVFRGEDGALTCDQVNLTGEILREAGDTGVIRLLGAEPDVGETLALGKAPAGAWSKASIKTASGRQLAVVESKPDEQGLVTVSGKIPTGFVITIQ